MHSRALSPPAAMGDVSPIPPVPPLSKEYQSSSPTANLDVQPPSPYPAPMLLSAAAMQDDSLIPPEPRLPEYQPSSSIRLDLECAQCPSAIRAAPALFYSSTANLDVKRWSPQFLHRLSSYTAGYFKSLSPRRVPTLSAIRAATQDAPRIPPVPLLPKECQSSSFTANLCFQPLSHFWNLKSSGNNTPRVSSTMGLITSPPQTSGSLPTIAEYSAIVHSSPPARPVVPRHGRSIRVGSSDHPSSTRVLRPAGRRRAMTLAGHELARISSLGFTCIPSEILQNVLVGVEETMRDFTALNRNTQTLASKWSTHVRGVKTLPSSSQPLTRDSPVGKGPSQFSDAEDYAYFSLLSIINTHLYDRIFHPFHPAASDAENAGLKTNYQRQVEAGVCLCLGTDGHNYAAIFCPALHIEAAEWRARRFQLIETRVDNLQRATLFRNISDSIQQAWLDSLDLLPGRLDALPAAFIADIEVILGNAYEWHRVVKVEVMKCDLEPFTVQPLSPYDPARMEPVERMRTQVVDGRSTVSPVSLGLVVTMAREGQRAPHVQFKARVLVEEWLSSNLSSASRLQKKGGGLLVTSMLANSSLLSRTFGDPPAPGLPVPSIQVPSIQDMPTGRMISQPPHYQTSHHTDVIPGDPLNIDSSHNQGDCPVEAEGDEDAYMRFPYLRQLLGSAGHSVQGKEAAELGSKLHLVCHHLKPDTMWLMLKFVPSI